MTQLKPFEHEEGPSDDEYSGNEGWVIVASGYGKSCYLAIDPGFGALRWWVQESGLDDPADAGLDHELDGVYRVRARAWTSRSWEGEHDMGFNLTSEWERLYTP